MTQATTDAEQLAQLLGRYNDDTGADRYARFIEEVLGYEVTEILRELAVALNTHEQTIAYGANGPGKSYSAALLGNAALYTNPDIVVPITAGNGDTLKNSIWKPIKGIWKQSGLPGDFKDNDRSLHTNFDPEWFLECHSPRHPDDLEGDHNANVLYIIEEADKPGVTHEHIDSARSTLGDDDHILVIANPPTDETNVVSDLIDSPEWYNIQFPTWESRNSRVDRGVTDKPKVDGITGVSKMRSDWREYHDEPWPGIEAVIELSSPYLTPSGEPTTREWEAARESDHGVVVGREGQYDQSVKPRENPAFRSDLHLKWYKRRAGVMPPDSSEKWRPWGIGDVEAAYQRSPAQTRETPTAAGIDVARSGDKTVLSGVHMDEVRVHYDEPGTNHAQQKADLLDLLKPWPDVEPTIDAVGEGSGLADELDTHIPDVVRFSNGSKAREESEYRDKWAEGLYHIGAFLRDGGSIKNDRLREELLVAARTVEFKTVTLSSRGGDVIEATPKEEVKERLGHSPDYLDSALMAIWRHRTQDKRKKVTMGW